MGQPASRSDGDVRKNKGKVGQPAWSSYRHYAYGEAGRVLVNEQKKPN